MIDCSCSRFVCTGLIPLPRRRRLHRGRGLLGHDASALRQPARAHRSPLQKAIHGVYGHRNESEERCSRMRVVMNGSGQDRHEQIEESPQRAEHELNLQPRDLVELLHHVEEVEPEQDAGEPERYHRDPTEERPSGLIVEIRKLDANEPENAA